MRAGGGDPDFHESLTREAVANRTSDRRFGLLLAAVFLFAAAAPLLHGHAVRWWALAPAVVFLATALAAPGWLAPLNRGWYRFGLLLHRIVSPVTMAVIFFGVVTPTAMLLRLRGKDPLRLKKEPASKSYWIPREPPGPAADGFPRMY